MKAKSTTDELHLDIGIPASLTAETGVAVVTAENLIRCYENEARKILKDNGCPLTFEELCRKRKRYLPDLANGRGTSPVYGIFWMLLGFNRVRVDVKQNNADAAVCDMAYALHWASDMQIRPLKQDISRGRSSREGTSKGGNQKKKIDDTRHAQWQLDAEAIWRKYTSFSKWRVAGILKEQYENSPTLLKTQDAIYRKITKPT